MNCTYLIFEKIIEQKLREWSVEPFMFYENVVRAIDFA